MRDKNEITPDRFTWKWKSRTCTKRKRNVFDNELFILTLKIQKNKCAVCGVDFALLKSKHICADHNHETKKPRGILCGRCNLGLGWFTDDPKKLQAAIDYLKDPPLSLI